MSTGNFRFQIEPPGLIDAILQNPPANFEFSPIAVKKQQLPAFLTEFDLLLTADESTQRIIHHIGYLLPKKLSAALLRPRALFIGTTVSEFALFPDQLTPDVLPGLLLEKMAAVKTNYLIVKDIAPRADFLSPEENILSARICESLVNAGFTLLDGQAMAYIPVDFDSLDEFFRRFSASRRADFRRKRKKRSDTQLHLIPTGDPMFQDPRNIDCFYQLYENVYDKSEIHFDKLTRSFFAKILTDGESGGLLFAYMYQGNWIGYALCFHRGEFLLDKYRGAQYPDFRNNNLYYVSWFDMLQYAIDHACKIAISGWTDPEIKAYLGSSFIYTSHAVYIANPLLRKILNCFSHTFESDRKTLNKWYAKHKKRGSTHCSDC